MTHPLWPLFDLRLRTEHLELRLPTDAELVALCAVAKAGIHPPDEMPFGVAWSTIPSPRFERSFAQHHWANRGTWAPERWHLALAAFLDGQPIGVQSLLATDFATLRVVRSASWLGMPYQGLGYGREMREAVLSLAFDCLGAELALTEAFRDNIRSARVSRSLGYVENGLGRIAPLGVARVTRRFAMTRARWVSRPHQAVAIDGLTGCLELFGVAGSSG
jgi:RimJ/RimL family protein N-acetyltransferase